MAIHELYNVILEDDVGHIWEGCIDRYIEIGEYASSVLLSNGQYAWGTVIHIEDVEEWDNDIADMQ